MIDAGVGPNDVPFLILDYVDGQPIDTYCDAESLSIKERVQLFVDVLDAVGHAHSLLIVHSDIKPNNILVTPQREVKLLDFGVARLLSTVNASARAVGLTPEYAAPEQLTGDRITTSTDIYSLGLLLYTLLAGGNPRRQANVSTLRELKAVAELEPPPLESTAATTEDAANGGLERRAAERRVSTSTFLRTLRGELNFILRKALAADPAERYRSATDFSADLVRYLRHEPVAAHPASLPYRTRKFVRRHRGSVLSGVFTFIALAATTAFAFWQMLEARKQRDFALVQQQIAASVDSFADLLFEEIGESGEAFTVNELLEAGVLALDKRRAAGRPYLTSTYYNLAQHFANLGQKERSLELLDTTLAVAEETGDTDLAARTHCSKANRIWRSDPTQARDSVRSARQITDRVGMRESLSTRVTCARAQSLILEIDGEVEQAAVVLRNAVDAIDASPVQRLEMKADVLDHLGALTYEQGDLAGAAALNAAALELLEQDGRDGTMGYVISSINQAILLEQMGEVLAANERRAELIRRFGAANARDAPVALTRTYAIGLVNLGRHEEALEFLLPYRELAEAGGDATNVARIDVALGRALANRGDFVAAHEALDRAETFYSIAADAHNVGLRGIAMNRAYAYLLAGRLDAAQPVVDELLVKIGYPATADGIYAERILWTASRVALAQGRSADAEDLANAAYEKALQFARNAESSGSVGLALLARAEARIAQGERETANADLASAITALSNGFGPEYPEAQRARTLSQSP